MESMKKLEQEEIALEKVLAIKEKEYASVRGTKYMSMDDFKQYAAALRGKTNQYKKLKGILGDIKTEIGILNTTETIIRQKASEMELKLLEMERSKGIPGYSEKAEQIEKISEEQEAIDANKQLTLEEISKKVVEIENKLEAKREHIGPIVAELRELKEEKFQVYIYIYTLI